MGPFLLRVDTRELRKFEKDLAKVRKSAFPYATKNTLNTLAFEARREYQIEAGQKMKLRSKFTVNSVRVEKAEGLKVATQKAVMGSVADYMGDQESGAVHSKKGARGEPIPAAAPGKRKNRGRVARARQLGSINILPRVKGSRARQVGAAFSMASKRGGKAFAFIKLRPGRQGIYEINPGRKRLGLKKVWDLSKGSVRIPRNPMMQSAVQRTNRLRDGIWRESLLFQLRRNKAFGY
jgi:hypothetical protein